MTSLLLTLACQVAEAPPARTEADDLDEICKAIYAGDWSGTEAQWDQSVAGPRLTSERGIELQALLVDGPARSPESIEALVAAIRETGANQTSIDCALIEGYAPTLQPDDGGDRD